MPIKRDEPPMPAVEPEDRTVAASDSPVAGLSDTAPALINDAVSATMATTSTTTSTTAPTTMTKEPPRTMVVAAAGGKSKKGLYGVALMVGLLIIAASVAIPVFKSHSNQKPDAVAQQAEPSAVSSELPSAASQESQAAAVIPQPVEQIEVRASDPPSAGVDKPARIEKERPEKNITEVPYVEPPAKPAPEPVRANVSPNANKPTVLAPPRVASAPNAQGGAEPRGESAGLPRNGTGMPEPPPLPTAPVHKSSVITPSQSAHTVQPEYPQLAKTTRQSGVVAVEVMINDRGDVTSARALSGPPLLREAALSAARRWKFKPAIRDGKPVGSTTTLSFNFKM
jgi:protein TonB